MRGICVFSNDEFGDLMTISIDSKPYIEGIKTAKILGYKNANDAIKRHCLHPGVVFSEVGVITGTRRDSTVANQKVTKLFINEGNLYRLIVKSKKESAMKFESWVMDEVLPSIRRDGRYIAHNSLDDDNCMISTNSINRLVDICKSQQSDIRKLIDYGNYNTKFIDMGKTIIASDGDISIGGFAKLLHSRGINIGRNRLFEWFRARGYIMKQGMENQPKQVYIDKGLFVTKQYSVNTSEGTIINVTPYVTAKGQVYFIDKIKGEFMYEEF